MAGRRVQVNDGRRCPCTKELPEGGIPTRKLSFILALLLVLSLCAGALAEGILPVLQTPPPEITETISYHRVMNFSSTPTASSASDGSYRYEYSSVLYNQ